MQADKIGRASIRPWYAASHAPLLGRALRVWRRFSCYWWKGYLKARPVAVHRHWDLARRHVRMWTDASGKSRWLAAVILMDGAFHWTRWRCDDRFWALLLPRLDHNIGTQEMMAVVLGVYTWLDDLRGVVLAVRWQ